MSKLAIKLGDAELAAKLEAAGFDNPRKIRDASDRELKAAEGIGQAALDKIRAKFPKG